MYGKSSFSNKQASKTDKMTEVAKKRKCEAWRIS
jgi:hypothetical protein